MTTEEIQAGDRKVIRQQGSMMERKRATEQLFMTHGAIIYSAPNKLCGDEFRRTRITQPITWRERLMEKN
jgi:hypothetical protein